MKADPYYIKDIFALEKQLFAPLFQRPYVWKKDEQWEPLWRDIQAVADPILAGNFAGKPHFLGAVVLEQIATPMGRPDRRSIIDGQQRLTTLQLLLGAIRDVLVHHDELSHSCRKIENLLFNANVKDTEDSFKVVPTNVDRPVFYAIMDTKSPEELKQRIKEVCPEKRTHLANAYRFFHGAVSKWLRIGEDGLEERCDALVNAIREKLRIVVIDMDHEDDAQMIFETLNARGTPLLPSDLVKNFLFRRALETGENVELLHAKYWDPFDVEDSFWRGEIGKGQNKRARIDIFLQHYLALKKGDDVASTELFAEFCAKVSRDKDKNIEWHLCEFRKYAVCFQRFFNMHWNSREGIFFDRLNDLETMAVFPFLLGLYADTDNGKDTERLHAILDDVESFLVRRMVCRLSTKGYNRLFLDLVAEMINLGAYTVEGVRKFFVKQTADSGRWPSDEEFRQAWLSLPIYNSVKRSRLRLLLRALDSSLHTNKTENYYVSKSLTIEHIMPQHWEAHWPLPKIDGESPEEMLARRQQRENMIHTIGNLAFVTKALNPSISNGSFKVKRDEILKHCALNINRVFLHDCPKWDEESITERGERLCLEAKKIWPRPNSSPPEKSVPEDLAESPEDENEKAEVKTDLKSEKFPLLWGKPLDTHIVPTVFSFPKAIDILLAKGEGSLQKWELINLQQLGLLDMRLETVSEIVQQPGGEASLRYLLEFRKAVEISGDQSQLPRTLRGVFLIGWISGKIPGGTERKVFIDWALSHGFGGSENAAGNIYSPAKGVGQSLGLLDSEGRATDLYRWLFE